ncbi:MAG: hypothetical protein ACOX4Q_07105 [Syntrophomonadales bacterium]
MPNNAKYDFSRESHLKGPLFQAMKKDYQKARWEIALSDDDLEKVVAAGANAERELCPLSDQTCDKCDKYKLGVCTAGYTKDGG